MSTFRSAGSAERVRALGAEPTALDLLDACAVRHAVLETQPEAIVRQVTALVNARRPGRLGADGSGSSDHHHDHLEANDARLPTAHHRLGAESSQGKRPDSEARPSWRQA